MNDFWTFMAAPALGCFVLAVSFTYFGIHVLKREIIFVDLSLAQLAALGTVIGIAFGVEQESFYSFGGSLIFVTLGALFFSSIQYRFPKISQEAVIGIVYVFAASLAIIVANLTPHSAEHIQHMLNGSILWLTWEGLAQLVLAVLMIAFPSWAFRHKFYEISAQYKTAGNPNRQKTIWDFIFYLLLGLLIIVSVDTAGIFLVFALLIIPAFCGTLVFDSFKKQFLSGIAIGTLVSLIGLSFSFYFDLPTGATIVCSLGVIFLMLLASRIFFLGSRKTSS